MEYESSGLAYRYVYGNDRLSVTVSGLTCDGDDDDCEDHKKMVHSGVMPLYYHMDRLG